MEPPLSGEHDLPRECISCLVKVALDMSGLQGFHQLVTPQEVDVRHSIHVVRVEQHVPALNERNESTQSKPSSQQLLAIDMPLLQGSRPTASTLHTAP